MTNEINNSIGYIVGKTSIPNYFDWKKRFTTSYHWRGTKEPLDEGERGQCKSWLKLNIQKTRIMASGPITSWEIDGETVETVSDFIFGGSKITAEVNAAMKLKDACSLEEQLWPT